MMIIKNGMMTNFDWVAFYEWANTHANGVTAVARKLGYNDSFFANARKRNGIRPSVYEFLKLAYNLPEGTFIKKEEEKVVENTPTKDTKSDAEIQARFKDIANELTDLNNSVNKLGNIMMQMLEYLKEIRDEVK